MWDETWDFWTLFDVDSSGQGVEVHNVRKETFALESSSSSGPHHQILSMIFSNMGRLSSIQAALRVRHVTAQRTGKPLGLGLVLSGTTLNSIASSRALHTAR